MIRHDLFTLLSFCILGFSLFRLGTITDKNTARIKSSSISPLSGMPKVWADIEGIDPNLHHNLSATHKSSSLSPSSNFERSIFSLGHDDLSASERAFRKCMQRRNGSQPVSHAEMLAWFARDQDILPVDMRSTKWVDFICPGIHFDSGRKSIFENVYSSAAWTHGNANVPLSGSGSTVEGTSNTRAAIMRIVSEHQIRSIVDVPCGDLNWMPEMFSFFRGNNVTYIGIDIVSSLIEKHRMKFPHLSFHQLDYARHEIPVEAELIFNREALQHLNFYDVFLALHHFSLVQKGRYLLTTSYESEENNNFKWVDGATNTILQLDQSPYFLRPEAIFEDGRSGGINRLKLFRLPLVRMPPKRV
jgi:hypothetical protein